MSAFLLLVAFLLALFGLGFAAAYEEEKVKTAAVAALSCELAGVVLAYFAGCIS